MFEVQGEGNKGCESLAGAAKESRRANAVVFPPLQECCACAVRGGALQPVDNRRGGSCGWVGLLWVWSVVGVSAVGVVHGGGIAWLVQNHAQMLSLCH